MANKLKAITTKAKALYKSGKFKKWTDAIKAASKSIGYSKDRIKLNKELTKETKALPKTLFPYTYEERLVKAGKKMFTEKAKSIAGTKKKTASKAKSYHKDTKSHNVNIRVVSGLSKITGIPHKAKYYVKYVRDGVNRIEYFEKIPKGYYKGMEGTIYLFTLTDSGSTLVPIVNVRTNKPVKK
jgi:hypothetical protein